MIAMIFVQVYLIAAFIFGDPQALDIHRVVGRVVVGFELVVLVTALVGWWSNSRLIGMSSALFGVGALQALLAHDIGSAPRVHALHGFLALVVFVLAWFITISGWRELYRRPVSLRSSS